MLLLKFFKTSGIARNKSSYSKLIFGLHINRHNSRTYNIQNGGRPRYWKLKVCHNLCNRSTDRDEILHEYAVCGCKNAERLKFSYFKYSRWWTAAIVGIKNLQFVTVQPIGTKFCRNMQIASTNRVDS